MTWTPFNSFLGRPVQCYFNGSSAPAPTSFYLILINGGTIDATSSLAAVLAQECTGYGYARQQYLLPSASSYDSSQSRYENPLVTLGFNASGGAIQFDKAVLLGGAAATGSSGELICFQAQSAPTTIPDGASYSFQVAFNAGGATADVNAA